MTQEINLDGPHLYVTRTAVLGYQAAMGGGFETIRRMLTTHLLGSTTPDPEHEGCYLIRVRDSDVPQGHTKLITFRVYTTLDGSLLVVTKVELAEPAA